MDKYEIENMMSNLQSYLERNGIDTSKLFTCINPNHEDRNPSMKYFDDNKVYCYGCRQSYDLVGAISVLEHLDRKQAFKRAIELYYNKYIPNQQKPFEKQNLKPKKENVCKDYSKAFYFWQNNFSNSKNAKEYIINRGIDLETAKKFNIGFNKFTFKKIKGFDKEYEFNAVIIPINKNCFIARNIVNDGNIKYYKPTGCEAALFNKEALQNTCPYCVLTEGEFDALSFITVGINAMALSSANNINKFIEMEKPLNKIYILAFDNDKVGNMTTEKIIDYFDSENIPYIVFDNCGYKDANQALTENKELFEKSIQEMCEEQIIRLTKKTQNAEM